MFLKGSIMRYYRVWIYSCNLALFLATIIFIALFIWLLSDVHITLFTSINFYDPTFIYGFGALVLQGGVLQAIGYLGAVRMNEKLLTLYNHILVALLFGDAIVGVAWLFRYNYITNNLKSDLKYKLNNDYGYDPSFQELWDRIQSESKCCGIDGPYDYNLTKWLQNKQEQFPGGFYSQLVPKSCCRLDAVTHLTHRSHNPHSSPLYSSSSPSSTYHPQQHYPSHSLHHSRPRHPRHHHYNRHHSPHHKQSVHSAHSSISRRVKRQEGDEERKSGVDYERCVSSYSPDTINVYGCYDSISKWFQRTIETLSVIGFCVITFLKLCFAFILRYEIKEMIQKIQMLKGEASMSGCIPAAPLHELEAYLPRASIQQDGTFETQFVSANQCQSPPSSSVNAAASPTAQSNTADTLHERQMQQNRQQHRLNSRVDQVRQSSLTSASTITTTAILNSPIKSSSSTPVTSSNNGNNNEMLTSCSSTTTSSTIKSRGCKIESGSPSAAAV